MNFSDREHFPPRRKTRPVKVGRLVIGGDAPIVVQSMTKTDTRDVEKTVEQARQMEAAGCEIVRMAVPDIEAAKALAEIRRHLPDSILVSDIHYQYKFADQERTRLNSTHPSISYHVLSSKKKKK